jgi:hypothetical protein
MDPIENAVSDTNRAALASAVGNALVEGQPPVSSEDKRKPVPRLRDFSIDITINGERFVGDFTNSVCTVGMQSQRGALAASLAVGQPYESLDPYTRDWNEKVAHLRISLVKKPSWFTDIAGIVYHELIEAVYVEVAAHETEFRGLS